MSRYFIEDGGRIGGHGNGYGDEDEFSGCYGDRSGGNGGGSGSGNGNGYGDGDGDGSGYGNGDGDGHGGYGSSYGGDGNHMVSSHIRHRVINSHRAACGANVFSFDTEAGGAMDVDCMNCLVAGWT